MEACVEKSPEADFLNNLLDGALLDARLTSLIDALSHIVHVVDARVTVCHDGVLSHSLQANKLRHSIFVVFKTVILAIIYRF